MKRPLESAAISHAVYAVAIGLRGNAIASDGASLSRLVCSAPSASGTTASLPASIDHSASNPHPSAFRAAAGTSLKSRVTSPVSSFIIEASGCWDSRARIVTEARSWWNVVNCGSRVQQSEQTFGIVGHDSVDAECQHLAHLRLGIHGPYMDFNSKLMRGGYTLGRHKLPGIILWWYFERVAPRAAWLATRNQGLK